MLKESHYKVDSDARKHYSLLAILHRNGKLVDRTRANHKRARAEAFRLECAVCYFLLDDFPAFTGIRTPI